MVSTGSSAASNQPQCTVWVSAESRWCCMANSWEGEAAPYYRTAFGGTAAGGDGSVGEALPVPWHFLYFLPLPHGHGSLRPGSGGLRSAGARGPRLFQSWRRSYTAQM